MIRKVDRATARGAKVGTARGGISKRIQEIKLKIKIKIN
jgi:hypothetical protein